MTKRLGMTFIPRELVAQPAAFGYSGSLLKPADKVVDSDFRYRAAMVQHIVARQVRDGLKTKGVTLKSFLAGFDGQAGLSAVRMGRVLRGEQMATFADIAFWSEQFPKISGHVTRYMDTWTASPSGGAAG